MNDHVPPLKGPDVAIVELREVFQQWFLKAHANLDFQAAMQVIGVDLKRVLDIADGVVEHPASSATPHVYLSTGCLHGEHAYCQSNTGAAGAKTPAQCKFCAAPCICDCHTAR